ncbi:hypothetical protein PR048_033318 [Dryococelus australis]|uniref:Uncharacterized protein n=1 Tax=Dryococelus australis TaxID=614101 RepID=A0ABQ9G2S4_9NEOP|nr:hypothetical protein PR048_033318 [Dryococelus australis]
MRRRGKPMYSPLERRGFDSLSSRTPFASTLHVESLSARYHSGQKSTGGVRKTSRLTRRHTSDVRHRHRIPEHADVQKRAASVFRIHSRRTSRQNDLTRIQHGAFNIHKSANDSRANRQRYLSRSAPLNEHFTIMCPNHMQFGQKERDFASVRQPMKKRRQLELICEVQKLYRERPLPSCTLPDLRKLTSLSVWRVLAEPASSPTEPWEQATCHNTPPPPPNLTPSRERVLTSSASSILPGERGGTFASQIAVRPELLPSCRLFTVKALKSAHFIASKVRKRGSDTGDTNTHAQRLIAPTPKACSVSVLTLYCVNTKDKLDVGHLYPYRCKDTVFYWSPYLPAANQWIAKFTDLGNTAPINEHFTIVCPSHVQFSQKGCDRTSMQHPMGRLVSRLASHQGEPGSLPGWVIGFLQVGIVPNDTVGRRFPRGSPVSCTLSFRRRSIPRIPSSALKTSLLIAAQISSLTLS